MVDGGEEDFLFRIMELRERIEELKEEGNQTELKELKEEIIKELLSIQKQVSKVLGKLEAIDKESMTSQDKDSVDLAFLLLNKWKYLNGVLDAVGME